MSRSEVAMLLIQEGNSPKTQWPLVKDRTVIGRESDSDIQIDDRQVSRRHAEIALTPDGYYVLRDLGSKNGTFLNGQPVSHEPKLIRNGDEIGIALCAKSTFVAEEATAPAILGQYKPGIRLDIAAKRVWVMGKEIDPPLSLAQHNLLELLYINSGKVVSRDQVVAVVWSEEEAEGVSEQAIDALARRLRERIAEIDPNNKYVETVRGHGFRLNLTES
ncbi:MAG: FHA domain-containing protein [Anaerolineae bacterium]|nr:FHA domain-containing protein [Anaerolineae bacterium]MCB0176850.1 FHA domain-containing protein [Anaerolineae bacterium]MCB9102870.1 FHA domain-containing protein [Anaerolineales bacterium]